MMEIKCSGCEIIVQRKGYCKSCKSGYDKKRYLENREEKLSYQKKYQLDHREERLEYNKGYWENNREKNKNYRLDNKEKYKKWKRDWIKMKKETDPLFNFQLRIRKSISRSIKRNGFSKKLNTEQIIGISFENFKIYIEDLFQENMNWNNFGEWHLDHKIPLSWATNEEETIKLNHYTNFQPLWSYQNLSKGNKYSN